MIEKQQSILIVDDEPKNIQLLANILSSEGYRIEYAMNAAEAVEQVRDEHFDLFLLDVNMPKMNGFELCKKLKNDPTTKEVPVIFLSALDNVQNKILGFQAGGCDYITKPFQIDEVIARVKTHLELQQTKNSLKEAVLEKEKSNKMLAVILHSIPEFIIKEAMVITRYPGASPTQVEQEVTFPIENAVQRVCRPEQRMNAETCQT